MSKIWLRFSKCIDGQNVNFRWEQLASGRYEEFFDFMMEYYIKHEFTHTLAGLHKNSAALKEYREVATELYASPSYHNDICCVDDETNKIVGFNSLKLFKKGDNCVNKLYDLKPSTAEMQTFCKILRDWDNLFPVPDLLARYGVTKYFDDAGTAIHPDYRGHHILTEVALLREAVCKANNVPLTGAWMTSTSTRNTSSRHGWQSVYNISSEELEKILGIEFPKPSRYFHYNVKKIEL